MSIKTVVISQFRNNDHAEAEQTQEQGPITFTEATSVFFHWPGTDKKSPTEARTGDIPNKHNFSFFGASLYTYFAK
jgi:hypothetical protein